MAGRLEPCSANPSDCSSCSMTKAIISSQGLSSSMSPGPSVPCKSEPSAIVSEGSSRLGYPSCCYGGCDNPELLREDDGNGCWGKGNLWEVRVVAQDEYSVRKHELRLVR